MGTNKIQRQRCNIELNMELDEFRQVYYVFMKHGMHEAYNDEHNYCMQGKIDVTERLERKMKRLYDMARQSTDTDYIDTSYHQRYDIIEIDKNGYQYKKLK